MMDIIWNGTWLLVGLGIIVVIAAEMSKPNGD